MSPPLHHIQTSPTLPASADVVVIGGGIIGVFTAYYLAKRGLSVAVVDEPPQLRNRAELAPRMEELYPPGMRMAAIEGEVVVWFVVDVKGRVETDDLRIVSASNPGFEAPTRALVRLMRFEPARRNGKAVRVWVELPLRWASGT